MLDVFGLFSVPTLYVLIGISVLLIVAIILSIVAIAKSSAMKKKYNIMMEGSEGKSIEKIIKEYTDDVKLLKETYENNTKSIKDIYDKMQYTFQNARIIYMLLYDRARISRKNNWADEDGRVYAVFPIEELSQKTGKCKSSIKKALKELDDAGLLIRKFGGFSKPRHMYVMIPDKVEVSGKVQLQTDIKKADREFKNELSYGQNDNSTKDINTASNKVIEKNNLSNKYGVSSYSIKNQKMNYECGEGESL